MEWCLTSLPTQDAGDLGMSANVVPKLCRLVPSHCGFCVYFENFFTSIPLAIRLKEEGIDSVATIRSNRLKGTASHLNTEKELRAKG